MTAIDREMPAASAAQYLQNQLADGRSYSSLLQDMRREKRICRIPFHKDMRGWAWYYKADLDAFIEDEHKRSRVKRHDFLVERDDSTLGSWAPPTKRLKALH
jgi:hypothetical protein